MASKRLDNLLAAVDASRGEVGTYESVDHEFAKLEGERDEARAERDGARNMAHAIRSEAGWSETWPFPWNHNETMTEPFRCRYCDSVMKVSAGSYEENPWCVGCLDERMEKAAAENPLVGWRMEGDYMIPIRRG